MHTWQWQHWNDRPYLTCSLLASWPHGFFTQQFYPQSPHELIAALQPDAQVYRVKQVHGNDVLTPAEVEDWIAKSRRNLPDNTLDNMPDSTPDDMSDQSDNTENQIEDSEFPLADGMITEAANQSVWVCSADCTPVLIADVASGQVAAIHAGWRGTAQKIVPQALARLQAQGSQLQNLCVAMGPAIAGDMYQVSTQVAAEVGATVAKTTDPVAELYEDTNPAILPDPQAGRVRLDVRLINALQLQQAGLAPEQIAIAPHCTYQQPEYFFSYRRDRAKKVQWSGIVSRSARMS
jgi:hypothetical protein